MAHRYALIVSLVVTLLFTAGVVMARDQLFADTTSQPAGATETIATNSTPGKTGTESPSVIEVTTTQPTSISSISNNDDAFENEGEEDHDDEHRESDDEEYDND